MPFLIMVHWISLKYMAQRFVRLRFDFTCSFVFISVYSDINSFKLFLYVSAYFCLSIGGGRTQSHQDDGGTSTHGELKQSRIPWPILRKICYNWKDRRRESQSWINMILRRRRKPKNVTLPWLIYMPQS